MHYDMLAGDLVGFGVCRLAALNPAEISQINPLTKLSHQRKNIWSEFAVLARHYCHTNGCHSLSIGLWGADLVAHSQMSFVEGQMYKINRRQEVNERACRLKTDSI